MPVSSSDPGLFSIHFPQLLCSCESTRTDGRDRIENKGWILKTTVLITRENLLFRKGASRRGNLPPRHLLYFLLPFSRQFTNAVNSSVFFICCANEENVSRIGSFTNSLSFIEKKWSWNLVLVI